RSCGRFARSTGSEPDPEAGAMAPRMFPPSIANAGPPGCWAKAPICEAAVLRLTSGWASWTAEHGTLPRAWDKNAKLTTLGEAGRVTVACAVAGELTLPPAS